MKISAVIAVLCFLVSGLVHTALSTTTISVDSTTVSDGCPSEFSWEPHNRSCYLNLVEDFNSTQARESCLALGAHLVSIGSEEENQFILDFVGTDNMPVWIGLYEATNDVCLGDSCEKWVWLDGSKVEYTQWATGPYPSPGPCVFIDSQGDWYHNRQCSDELGYVCKQRQIIPTTTSVVSTLKSPTGKDSNTSSLEEDLVLTEDSTKADADQLSVCTGVGVTVGILFIVVIIGLTVYFIKTRRRNKRDMQASGAMSNGTGEYENYRREIGGQYPVCFNSVNLNPLSGKDIDIHVNQHGVSPIDPVYEQVVKYSAINPEYTDLQLVECARTSAVNQEDNYEVYLNVEQN